MGSDERREWPCMDADELARWKAMNKRALSDGARCPCEDCLPEFATLMRSLGRCVGDPGDMGEAGAERD